MKPYILKVHTQVNNSFPRKLQRHMMLTHGVKFRTDMSIITLGIITRRADNKRMTVAMRTTIKNFEAGYNAAMEAIVEEA